MGCVLHYKSLFGGRVGATLEHHGFLDGQMIRTLHLILIWTRPRLTSVPSEVVRLAEFCQRKASDGALRDATLPNCTVLYSPPVQPRQNLPLHPSGRWQEKVKRCVCLLLTDEWNPAGRRSESLQPLMLQLLFLPVDPAELNNSPAN